LPRWQTAVRSLFVKGLDRCSGLRCGRQSDVRRFVSSVSVASVRASPAPPGPWRSGAPGTARRPRAVRRPPDRARPDCRPDAQHGVELGAERLHRGLDAAQRAQLVQDPLHLPGECLGGGAATTLAAGPPRHRSGGGLGDAPHRRALGWRFRLPFGAGKRGLGLCPWRLARRTPAP
jgi:hypothetical protein